jgi:hypothetical protein
MRKKASNSDTVSSCYQRVREFARHRNISESLARQWIRDGVIPSIKVKGLILIDPVRADQALARFERREVAV